MALKDSNELTLKITCKLEDICKLLEEKEFKITEKFTLYDKYMLPKNLNISNISNREVLSKAVLIRGIHVDMGKPRTNKITFKNKEFDEMGNITYQNSINCDIQDTEDALRLFEAIGYYTIMEIIEEDIIYRKDGFEIAVKDIKNGDNLIEVETDNTYDTIDKILNKLKELEMPLDYTNLFVKKAEIELEKVRGNK